MADTEAGGAPAEKATVKTIAVRLMPPPLPSSSPILPGVYKHCKEHGLQDSNDRVTLRPRSNNASITIPTLFTPEAATLIPHGLIRVLTALQ